MSVTARNQTMVRARKLTVKVIPREICHFPSDALFAGCAARASTSLAKQARACRYVCR
jgi:hypothetical protein